VAEERPPYAVAEARVRTVLGDVRPEELGRTNAHEHLLMRSPLLRGEELDDLDKSAAEALALREAGIDALVELTTIGLGRDPVGVAEISRRTGLQVVLATGIHREAHYPPEHWVHKTDPEELGELFVRDLLEGCDGADYSGPRERPTTVRAGVIKVGVGYWSISPLERRVLQAAGFAHRRTGAPVVCHLELGTAAWEVLEALDSAGVPPERVALAHVDRNPDPVLLGELAGRGAYLGFDGAARHQRWPDSVLVDCLAAVVEGGGGDRVLLGGDVARRTRYIAYGGMPGLAYLFDRFVPRLRAAVGDAALRAVLADNPARWLSWEPER
jgi:phosphotriesterase-related protein